MSYRIIQWGAGNVGRHSLRGILDRPELELVGLRVYDASKTGRDAGSLIGQEPCGVIATDDEKAILGLEADCVLYNALGTTLVSLDKPVDDMVRLLSSGKNVIASAIDLFLYIKQGLAPKFVTTEVIDALNQACIDGGSTLYGTGMTPGFALDLWPITMSRVCRSVDQVKITEIVNLRDYESTMMEFMGFGLPPDAEAEMYKLFDDPANSPYVAALTMVADALGAPLDTIEYQREVAVSPDPLELPSGTYQAGTVVATRFRFIGNRARVPFVTIEYVWRLTDSVEPEWPTGHCKWIMDITGDPSVHSEMEFVTELDAKRPTSLTVAMHGLNAVPAVCAAPPGIVSHLNLPVFGGRAARLGSA
jgi:4-hydroxy-tetrahydrodipicolinate reductase